MTVVLALVVGLVTVRFLRMVRGDILAVAGARRRNYRDRMVPTAGGIYLVLTVLVVEAGAPCSARSASATRAGSPWPAARCCSRCSASGSSVSSTTSPRVGADRGFRGHLGALREGRVTTGLLKLVGRCGRRGRARGDAGLQDRPRRCSSTRLLIALAANFGNLLDRAPGRTIKVGLVAYVPLAIVLGDAPIGVAIAPVMGAALGLLGDDLRERLMLGDTGANVIGAVLGLGVVLGGARSGVSHHAVAARAQRRRRDDVVQPRDRRGAAAPCFDRLGRAAGRTRPDRYGASQARLGVEVIRGPNALGRVALDGRRRRRSEKRPKCSGDVTTHRADVAAGGGRGRATPAVMSPLSMRWNDGSTKCAGHAEAGAPDRARDRR